MEMERRIARRVARWFSKVRGKRLGIGIFLALIGAVLGLSCSYAWEIPSGPKNTYSAADLKEGGNYVIPQTLLSDSDIAEAARDCAVAANNFRSSANGDRFWSYVFGGLQVAGAGVGTASGAAAFEDGTQGKAAKVAVISFAVAAGIAALDQAYEPSQESAHSQKVFVKISHLILLAAAQLATGDKKTAQTTLASCQDPTDIDDGKTVADIETIQAQINRMVAATLKSDGGAPDK